MKKKKDKTKGIELASFPRGRGSVLRIALETWTPEGATAPVRYLGLRIWNESHGDGSMYPSHNGLTVRAHELREAIEALTKAAIELGVDVEHEEPAPQSGSRVLQ